MKASDTVIKNEDILDLDIPCETCESIPIVGFPSAVCLECIALHHREAQAEISFTMGMKKVVEWIRHNPSTEFYKLRNTREWEDFLKENEL